VDLIAKLLTSRYLDHEFSGIMPESLLLMMIPSKVGTHVFSVTTVPFHLFPTKKKKEKKVGNLVPKLSEAMHPRNFLSWQLDERKHFSLLHLCHQKKKKKNPPTLTTSAGNGQYYCPSDHSFAQSQ
jgi:hypothetical protein